MAIPKMDKAVLIVDDDPSSARVIKSILEKYGFRCPRIAHTGAQALNILGIPNPCQDASIPSLTPPVDIVLLDVVLPDINGFEVCDQIKKSHGPSLPVMIITGFDIPEYIARGVAVGADDFLSKPIVAEELVARINILLQRDQKHRTQANRKAVLTAEKPEFSKELPSPGKEIDRYTVENILSWSASTVVYTVFDKTTGVKYVLKQLLRQILEFPEVIDRFYREIEMMKGLDHPNICSVCDTGKFDGCPYCVIEYISGKNLESVLKESTMLDFSIIERVATGVAQALKHIHEVGIIHRDIKLHNIYLCTDGGVKLSDFGVAMKIGETRLTQHGYVIGTPMYMAPEQFEGNRVDHLADIYSYGASLYHLITGHLPFTAENVAELMYKHQNEAPISIERFRQGAANGWNELVVNRCLAKKPEDRPQSMVEILTYLKKIKK